MSDRASLRTALVPRSSSSYRSCWVRLEQIMPDEAKQMASVADIYNMWTAAASGRSAVALRPEGCPVEFDGKITRVFLGFYVWPSQPNLQYTLTVAMGRIGHPRLVRKTRSFSAIIDRADRYALPHYMRSVTVQWETPAYTPAGELILPAPQPRLVDGIWLVWDEPVFGAVRITGVAIGAAIVLEMEFERGIVTRPLREDEEQQWHTGPSGQLILTPTPESKMDSHRITDLKNAITVSSACGGDTIEQGDVENVTVTTETHDVVIPVCVQTALSLCPGEEDIESLACEELPDKMVYYNACTGSVMGSELGDDGSSYCSKVSTAPISRPWWLPEGGV